MVDYEQKTKGQKICGGITTDTERIISGLRSLKKTGQKKTTRKSEDVPDCIVKMIHDFFFLLCILIAE